MKPLEEHEEFLNEQFDQTRAIYKSVRRNRKELLTKLEEIASATVNRIRYDLATDAELVDYDMSKPFDDIESYQSGIDHYKTQGIQNDKKDYEKVNDWDEMVELILKGVR